MFILYSRQRRVGHVQQDSSGRPVLLHEGYRPRASQIEVANLVTEDLRKETAEVRPMMMGAGKQQSSPSVFDRVVLQRYRQGLARSLYIVLPKGLVKQSSHMLATELSPYSLIPIIVHTEEQFGQNPTPGASSS
jgi:hypothetical protein